MITLALAVFAAIAPVHVQASNTPPVPPTPPAPARAVSPGEHAPAASSPLQTRLEELDTRIAQVSDLTADFRQEKSTPLLRKPIVSTGRIRAKGDHVRWDTLEPRRTSMLLTNREIRLFFTDERALEIYPLEGDLRQMSGSPLPRLAWLQENFELAEISPDVIEKVSGTPADLIGIELTPKSERIREHISTVRVLIDTRVPCLKRLEMIDLDGHSTVVELSSIKVNTGLKSEELDLELPPDVKISRPLDAARPKKDKAPGTPDESAGKLAK